MEQACRRIDKDKGFYGQQLQRYYDTFERSQLRIYLFEDLCQNPLGVVQDIFEFLGVDSQCVWGSKECHIAATINPQKSPKIFGQKNIAKNIAAEFI